MRAGLGAVWLAWAAATASAQTPTPRIANGLPTNAFPEVGLFLTQDVTCTATLAGCHTAVTAAHCVCSDMGTGPSCNGDGFQIDPTTAAFLLPRGGLTRIDSIRVEPHFQFASQSDIAVLELGVPIRGLRPRPINTIARPPNLSSAIIVGYGRTGASPPDAGILRQGGVTLRTCTQVPALFNLCWIFQPPLGPPGTESNTCPGDSGGPLLVDFGTGLVLAGVHSGGTGAACDGTDNAFDTDVLVENAWLRAQSGVDFDQTACGDGAQVGDASVTSQSFSATVGSATTQSFAVPAGTKLLRVGLNGDFNGDFDLYVKPGVPPTTTNAACSSTFAGSTEFCEVPDPVPGTWYALLTLDGGPSAYQLSTTAFPENPPPPPLAVGDVVVSNFSSFELTQVDLATGDRVASSSSLRGSGPALSSPEGIALAADGSIVVANPFVPNVLRVDPTTGTRTILSGCTDGNCGTDVGAGPSFLQPRFVAIAAGGGIVVADRTVAGTYAIVYVDPATGNRTVMSGCLDAGCSAIVGSGPAIGRLFGIAVEADGHIVAADGLAVFRIDPATGNRTLLSGCPDATCTTPIGDGPAFGQPVDIAVEPGGALLVSYQIEDSVFGALRRVDPVTGERTLVSGCTDLACSSVRGAGPRFSDPFGVARDRDGTLLVADSDLDAILRVDPASGDRTLVSGCVDASCSSAAGTGGGFGEPIDLAVVPEPAAWADALAVVVALGVTPRRRRQSTRFTAGGDHAPDTASAFGQ